MKLLVKQRWFQWLVTRNDFGSVSSLFSHFNNLAAKFSTIFFSLLWWKLFIALRWIKITKTRGIFSFILAKSILFTRDTCLYSWSKIYAVVFYWWLIDCVFHRGNFKNKLQGVTVFKLITNWRIRKLSCNKTNLCNIYSVFTSWKCFEACKLSIKHSWRQLFGSMISLKS